MIEQKRYYLDTSIWLDFFEARDEPKLPKGKLAHALIKKIIQERSKIVYSNLSFSELEYIGYSLYELDEMFSPLKPFLIFVIYHLKETCLKETHFMHSLLEIIMPY